MSYRRDDVKAPVLRGLALRGVVSAMEGPLRGVLLDKLTADSGLELFRAQAVDDAPTRLPFPHPPAPTGDTLSDPTQHGPSALARAHAHLRAGGSAADVASRALAAAKTLDEPPHRMAWFIRRTESLAQAAAQASEARWKRGQPLGPWDGVPVVVKDELDVAGVPTTWGTKIRTTPAERHSTLVQRLVDAGAVVLGKANMHELGIATTGLNAHHGTARNPWSRAHLCGGSSSASAAVVAAGLCPVALGADGGGSIRIPAALCGVVGLKGTWGRFSEHGIPALCWSVGHAGPLGATVADVAAAYLLLAGRDEHDPVTWSQPAPHLAGLTAGHARGVRVGICWPYFEDADPDVVARCKEAVRALTDAGATVVELPAPDLNATLWAHSILILSEMREAVAEPLAQDSSVFALDVRANLAIGGRFTAQDYVHALRHCARLTRECLAQLHGCDVIATPTTACTAPLVPEQSLPDGESNLPVVDKLMRFIRLANLSGFPALSVPCGYDGGGLPVGFHLMGRPYEEALLLRLGRVVEAASPRRVPGVRVQPELW